MTDDAAVLKTAFDICLGKLCHPFKFEIGESCPESLALAQDGQPGQTRLKSFQADFLKKTPVLVNRPAPLRIVIALVVLQTAMPPAAVPVVLAQQQTCYRIAFRFCRFRRFLLCHTPP